MVANVFLISLPDNSLLTELILPLLLVCPMVSEMGRLYCCNSSPFLSNFALSKLVIYTSPQSKPVDNEGFSICR